MMMIEKRKSEIGKSYFDYFVRRFGVVGMQMTQNKNVFVLVAILGHAECFCLCQPASSCGNCSSPFGEEDCDFGIAMDCVF